ncbi:MAG: twin-arginine translocase subunit TatC [Bacteroidales bacterium]|nr:twin-arginine translocase subunit TatC [Bacteroidales bacterium]
MSAKNSQDESAEMSFWDHLDVLRASLFRIVGVLGIVLIGVFVAIPHIFDSFVLGPTKGDFFIYRLLSFMSNGSGKSSLIMPDLGGEFHVDIININVASQFLTHISTAFWFSLVIIFPYLIYEIWRFIKPALFPNEKKGVGGAFLCGTLLFFIGCAIGYCIVFPLTFRFLTQYQVAQGIVNQISLNSYISTFLTIVFIMGVVFELPVLAWILSLLGILNKSFLKNYRKYAVVVLLIVAALITPSGDPFTLAVVWLPLYLLYELSILVVRDKSS